MIEIEKKRDAQKDEIAELTSQKKKLKNKIDVLASIHAKRDVQVRQDGVDYFYDFWKLAITSRILVFQIEHVDSNCSLESVLYFGFLQGYAAYPDGLGYSYYTLGKSLKLIFVIFSAFFPIFNVF